MVAWKNIGLNRRVLLLTLLVGIAPAAGPRCFAAEQVIVGTADGHVIGFDGMPRGTNNIYQGPGDTSIAAIAIGDPVSSITLANWTGGGQFEVAIGTASSNAGSVHIYDATLTYPLHEVLFQEPVIATAAGDMGPLENVLVIGMDAAPGGRIVVYDQAFHRVLGQDTSTPITALALGDADPWQPNRELVVAGQSGSAKSGARLMGFRLAYHPVNGYTLPALWFTQWSPNNFAEAVVIGDLYTDLPGDEIAITGCSSQSAGDVRGDGSQLYQWTGAGEPSLRWQNNVSEVAPAHTTQAVVTADVMGGEDLEVISVGDSLLHIIASQPTGTTAADLQTIETNEPCTSVAVADVLGDDGVAEIIVGSANGLILVFEHTNPQDRNSLFMIDASPTASRGGILRLDADGDGSQLQVSALAATTDCIDSGIGDFNQDCFIDVTDMLFLSQQWLEDAL